MYTVTHEQFNLTFILSLFIVYDNVYNLIVFYNFTILQLHFFIQICFQEHTMNFFTLK
jgi:hypothetical protein